MSKKKADVMERERRSFIYGIVGKDGAVEVEGAIRRGVGEKAAAAIFDEMTDFARYAFNKSHAAAYAVVAFRTAFLKRHYPCEVMAALLPRPDGPTRAPNISWSAKHGHPRPAPESTSGHGLPSAAKISFGLWRTKTSGGDLSGADGGKAGEGQIHGL
jgi:DNA polymerase-3 subunit alpha